MRLGADASVAIITELSDKRRCMRWHNWRLQYDVCHNRRRQAAVGASVCSKCSAADKHANWCATWVKCCWLWEIYVRIADSCQKWAARRDSETVETVPAVCICRSSSICKHYNDPTTSGPGGIISTGVANFSVQPDETEHELGWLSSCYAALCHFTWLRLRLWLWAVWFH